MEVHRLTCHQCGSQQLTNLIVRESGKTTQVYVQCLACDELVASYKLRAYYNPEESIEVYLREHGAGAVESGRKWLADFEQLKQEANDGFAKAVQIIDESDSQAPSE